MSAIDRVGGWSQLLSTLLRGEDLPADDAQVAMNAILIGEASSAQIAAFVMALRSKGETADELQGMLAAVLDASESVPLDAKFSSNSIDIVGTGGDKSHSVNISTRPHLLLRVQEYRCANTAIVPRLRSVEQPMCLKPWV